MYFFTSEEKLIQSVMFWNCALKIEVRSSKMVTDDDYCRRSLRSKSNTWCGGYVGVSAPEQFDSVFKTYNAVTKFYMAVPTAGLSVYNFVRCTLICRWTDWLTVACIRNTVTYFVDILCLSWRFLCLSWCIHCGTLCHTTWRDSRLLACWFLIKLLVHAISVTVCMYRMKLPPM